MLAESIANLIVKEISHLVQKDINIMDEKAVIIASSNPTRLGQSHWGAEKVIIENLPELYVENDEDSVYEGINFPLFAQNKLIGVIGITGKYEEISQIGLIVKKMAEIMLENQYACQRAEIDKMTLSNFLEDLILSRDHEYSDNFLARAADLKVNLKHRFILALVKINSEQEDENNNLEQSSLINATLENHLHHLDAMLLRRRQEWIIFFNWDNKPNFNTFCRKINQELERQYDCRLTFAFSSVTTEHQPINSLYKEASHALKVAQANGRELEIYDACSLELLISHLPTFAKNQFLKSFLTDLSSEESQEYLELIRLYFKHEGSLQRIADELFIHVNTLQYRLKNLCRLTGKDIRKMSQSPYYYIALLMASNP